MLIEVQYRTQAQHAWATAVEIADLLTKSRAKFSDASPDQLHFFRICSEIIARSEEGITSCLPKLSNRTLISEFSKFKKPGGIFRLLKQTNLIGPKQIKGIFEDGKNKILVYPFDASKTDFLLQVYSKKSTREALQLYEELEEKWLDKGDVVLVGGSDVAAIRIAFQNYFVNATDFVNYMEAGVSKLSAL